MARLSGRLPLGTLATSGLHLAVLWSFAVAQPLFDLLGAAPEFFVARENTTGDIVVLALGLTFVPPLVLTGIEGLAELVSPRLRRALHLFFVSVLVAAFVLQLLEDVDLGPALLIALALLAGVVAGVAYALIRAAPLLLTVLSPAPVLFMLVFLFISPVSKLILPGSEPQTADVTIPGSTPVVMIVFDELAGYSLMDHDGRVNAQRYPNFARLAADSTWYRNATAVADFTDRALPALLTGDTPDPAAAPIAADHPDSLFTLLGGRYAFDVIEPVTDVCPHALCPAEAVDAGSRANRLGSLVDDLSLVSLHLLLPDGLGRHLDPVDRSFGDFGAEESAAEEAPASAPSREGRALEALASITDRIEVFRGFERRLRGAKAEARLFFLHLQMPHNPYHFLPNGQRYPDPVGLPGLDQEAGRAGGIWARDRWLTEQALQRYLFQVGFTDLLLGRALERLRATGVYDRALIVVLADHGASFRAGEPHRAATAGNLPDIAGVPLFVKAPNQEGGRISDANVHLTDLLPTLAGKLDVRLPWGTDGRSADRAPADGVVSLRPSEDDRVLSLPFRDYVRRRNALVEQIAGRFGQGPTGLWGSGPDADLMGRSVDDLDPRVSPTTRFSLDAGNLLADVQPEGERVPALISGRISGLSERTALAVALQSRVAATTMPYRDGDAWRFVALVPPDALAEGENRVDLIAVEGSGDGRRFERLRGLEVTYRLAQQGDRQVIVDPAGRRIPVGPSALTGYVDQLSLGDTEVTMRGWAGDTERPRAAARVVAFAGNSFVGSAKPSVAREDLVPKFGPELSRAGFELGGFTAGPKPGSPAAPVRVFAILDGRASPVAQPGAP